MMMSISPDIVGAIGGAIASVSLIPQVVHTCRTRSAGDLSYSWQITHITGLLVDVLYMVLLGGTAGWIFLIFEIFFALMLLTMKLQIEGMPCLRRRDGVYHKPSKTADCDDDDDTMDCSSSSNSSDGSVEDSCDVENQIICSLDEEPLATTVDLTSKFYVEGPISNDEDQNDRRAFRALIEARFTNHEIPIDFGEMILLNLKMLADLNKTSVVCPHLDTFDKETDPQVSLQGFALSALLDDTRLSAFGNAQSATLSIELHSSGVGYGRTLVRDLVSFLQKHAVVDVQFKNSI